MPNLLFDNGTVDAVGIVILSISWFCVWESASN
jgi:hypothetical protein